MLKRTKRGKEKSMSINEIKNEIVKQTQYEGSLNNVQQQNKSENEEAFIKFSDDRANGDRSVKDMFNDFMNPKPNSLNDLGGIEEKNWKTNIQDQLDGTAKAEKIKEQIFNEDGTLNIEKAGELFESGELTVWDFEKVFGAIPNRSEQVSVTLDDGTKVYCEDMRWSGLTDSAVLVVTTPDGKEHRFEQSGKGNDIVTRPPFDFIKEIQKDLPSQHKEADIFEIALKHGEEDSE